MILISKGKQGIEARRKLHVRSNDLVGDWFGVRRLCENIELTAKNVERDIETSRFSSLISVAISESSPCQQGREHDEEATGLTKRSKGTTQTSFFPFR